MKALLAAISAVALIGGLSLPGAYAHPHHGVSITQINDQIALETITAAVSIPEDQNLKWATMKGMVSDPVEWYPVIIQVYKASDPTRFAQVDLRGDNSYEYQFQIRNPGGGSHLDVSEGEYTVKISAVVYHTPH